MKTGGKPHDYWNCTSELNPRHNIDTANKKDTLNFSYKILSNGLL